MSNYFTSFGFFTFFLISVVAYRTLAGRLTSSHARQGLLFVYNIMMLSLLGGLSWKAQGLLFGGVAVYVTLAVAGAAVLAKNKQAGYVYPLLTAIFLAVMLLLKYPYYCNIITFGTFMPQLGFMAWIGMSYMFFRSVDLLAFSAKSNQGVSLMAAANYLLFFPAFVSGPINRFRQFQAEAAGPPAPLSLEDMRAILLRLSIGVIKVLFVANIFFKYSAINPATSLTQLSFWQFAASLVCYFFYIYFNFSGYTDCAIACGRAVGFTLPENFNHPLAARNIQNFWERWHISLSQWFRDYIFFNLMYKLKKNKIITDTFLATCVSIVFTFFIMGAWHGDTIGWIGYGLALSVGLLATLVYGRVMDKFVPGMAAVRENVAYRVVCAAGTIGWVCVCLSLTLDFTELAAMMRSW
jgi:alginate O-acetyltransferase complex protein AlgI